MYLLMEARLSNLSRMALVGIIHNHCLTIQPGAFDDSAALTLMSNDVGYATGWVDTFHDLWSQALELGIGMYQLANKLGWVCMIPIAVVLCESRKMTRCPNAVLTSSNRYLSVCSVYHRESCRSTCRVQCGEANASNPHQGHPRLDEEYQDDGAC